MKLLGNIFRIKLRPPFMHDSGYSWCASLPEYEKLSDSENGGKSPLLLYEDGKRLGPSHSLHEQIRKAGNGRYSHWGKVVYFSTSDNSNPGENGRTYAVALKDLGASVDILREKMETRKIRSFNERKYIRKSSQFLKLPRTHLGHDFYQEAGHCWQVPIPDYEELSDDEFNEGQNVLLLEGNKLLGPSHTLIAEIEKIGMGRYSHWGSSLYFSTSDNSDPRKNKRTYSIAVRERKNVRPARKRLLSHIGILGPEHLAIWNRHPQGGYLTERGGEHIPPPITCSIPVTSYCNLRCTICGAQNSPEHIRKHMDIEVFRSIAKTLFPLMTQIEINSLGEPLVHPHIEEMLETVRDYNCYLRLQTNATLLTPRRIKILSSLCGEIFLSIDATGILFDKVRLGAKWKKVDEGVRSLTEAVDPSKLNVWLTATISERTLPDMINLLDWAQEVGIQGVHFRKYRPIMFGTETPPGDEDWGKQICNVKKWLKYNVDLHCVTTEDKPLKGRPALPAVFPDKKVSERRNYPAKDLANPLEYICYVPFQYIEVGLNGEIYLCCRTQGDPMLGYATSVESFADAWFGELYNRIRESLKTGFKGKLAVRKCDECIRSYTHV